MEVVNKDEFQKKLEDKLHLSPQEINVIFKCFMDTLFEYILAEKSIDFGKEYSRMKVKKSSPNIDPQSPRIPRKDHYIVSMKVKNK